MVHREVISAKTAIKARSPERKCGKTISRTDIIRFRRCKQMKQPMPASVRRVDVMYIKVCVCACMRVWDVMYIKGFAITA